MRRQLVPLAILLTLPLAAAPGTAQSPAPASDTTGAFIDAGAAGLMRRAREARLGTDRSLRSYTAIVRSRFAAGLRMPLKDRTLFRQETATRVRWSRDDATIVQLLASRTQHPGGVEVSNSGFGIDQLFDPTRDRMYFGLTRVDEDRRNRDDDDFWIEHPLGETAERHYRYQSGDTLTVTLQDGRIVRVIELRVMPRRNDPHTVRGVLWVDGASGALVQGAFRLARTVDMLRDMNVFDDDDCTYRVGEDGRRQGCENIEGKIPGFLKPFEFDISLVTMEYSLWDMKHWLPRSMRFEGFARAGAVRFPATADISYTMQDVLTDATPDALPEAQLVQQTLQEWNAADDHSVIRRRRRRQPMRVLMPRDTSLLLRSEILPPPVWADAPGFPTQEELQRLYDRVASVAGPARPEVPVTFGWGFGEPDMLRYNRVEALSLGATVKVPLPHVKIAAVARIGVGDLHPNAELRALRETMHRTLELNAYHRLTAVDEYGRALGFANSMSALLLGRDEGEYYRATGASLELSPPPSRRHAFDLRTYVEVQRAVERNTHVSLPRLWTDSVFRANIAADTATQYGALLHVRPWWGTDPRRAQLGIDLLLQGELGDFEHARTRLTLRSAVPLGSKVRLGLEAAAGTSEGDVPVQRFFFLGGASTLRGYEPSTVAGTSMARGRLEIGRAYSFGNLALFSDWGWAGDRDHIRSDDQRWAVGAGFSLLDGLLRFDLARGLRQPRGWRLDMHLDAIM